MGTLFALAFIAFIVSVLYGCIFRVPDVHIGLPSSLIGGRFKKKKDKKGNNIPIREPYSEGFHIKPPWISVLFVSTEYTLTHIEKEFPVGAGGSVTVKALIQWRCSGRMAFRFVEVDNSAIDEGLKAELEQLVIEKTGNAAMSVEKVIQQAKNIAEKMKKVLCCKFLDPGTNKQPTRSIFGNKAKHRITFAEHSYGIDIRKVSVDITPSEEMRKARDDRAREKYEKESQGTEWDFYLEIAKKLKEQFPELSDREAWEAVQVSQGQTTKTVHDLQMKDLSRIMDKIPELITAIRR
jgi:hypothetical protein